MSTPNLDISLILENQNNKATTCNDAILALEGALAGDLTVPMADANQTPAGADCLQTLVIICTGALSATRNLIVPTTSGGSAVKKAYILFNDTTGSHDIVIKTAAGTGVTVAAGASKLVYMDGTNVRSVG
jgi:hypothetical protein